jgi:hypothetical protein
MKTISTALVLCLAVASCSLPSDDSIEVIAQTELAPSLQQSTTTTSTTLPEVRTVDFAYYLLANQADSEQRFIQQVPPVSIADGSLFEAIEPMEVDGFKETIGANETLFNVVPQYDIVDVVVDGNRIATVSLVTLVEAPDNRPLRDVAAQLVWTLTGDERVDGVLFVIDGDPVDIPTTNENTPERPVTIDDYQAYNAEADDTTTTSTSSTTTTTTVPLDDN